MTEQQTTQAVNVLPPRRTRPQRLLVYLAVLTTVYVVASLGLGVYAYLAGQHNAHEMEQLQRGTQHLQQTTNQLQQTTNQLQRATNHNLCEQQAYGAFATCEGN